MKIVDISKLKTTVIQALEYNGVPLKDAEIVAEHLVQATLSGRDSHGVLRLPWLVKGIKAGKIRPVNDMKVVHETVAVASLDGRRSIGQVVSLKAMELAVNKAASLGVGVVSVKNSSHVGFLGFYTEFAAKNGMIGIAFTNTEPAMAPTGCAEKILGTNPISIGIPSLEEPIIADMATSMVARGKIVEAMRKGQTIPKVWAVDARGEQTDDPQKALEGALLPIAGPKGYCLAFAFDILTGALSGADVGRDVKGTLHTDEESTKGDLFMAINPEVFCSYEQFMERVERLRTQVKSCRRSAGVTCVYLPGEPELLKRRARMQNGIPVDEQLWDELEELCNSTNVQKDIS